MISAAFWQCATTGCAGAGQVGPQGEKKQKPTLGHMVLTLVRSPEPLPSGFGPGREAGKEIIFFPKSKKELTNYAGLGIIAFALFVDD